MGVTITSNDLFSGQTIRVRHLSDTTPIATTQGTDTEEQAIFANRVMVPPVPQLPEMTEQQANQWLSSLTLQQHTELSRIQAEFERCTSISTIPNTNNEYTLEEYQRRLRVISKHLPLNIMADIEKHLPMAEAHAIFNKMYEVFSQEWDIAFTNYEPVLV